MDRIVRAERPEDVPAVRDLHRLAFAARGDDVADLLDDLRRGPGPVHGVVAVVAGDVVGHALLTACRIDSPRRLVEALVLSPLAVAADHRRRGIGRELVQRVLADADAQGAPMVLLEGSPAYYGPLGFVPASSLSIRRPSLRIPPVALQAHQLSRWEPWMTGTMVYPDVWWRHDFVGLREGDEPGTGARTIGRRAP